MIQGFVPTKSTHTGLYSKQPRARSKIDTNKTATADQLCSSIAKYIERAYASHLADAMPALDPTEKINLHVEDLQCTFSLDHLERCMFLYADYVAIDVEKNRQRVEEEILSEKDAREKSAAESVYNEVVSLLTQANRTGLSVEKSFCHFDVNNNGYFDCDMLIDGLARLGIGVTYPVAEKVLEMMSGIGSHFLTLGDFQSFVSRQIEKESLYSTGNLQDKSSPSKWQKTKQANSQSPVKKDLLPPEKDWQSIGKSFADILASQAHILRENDVAAEEEYELPLPEEMYTTRPEGLSSETNKGDALPSWARKRSRRALQSLQSSQKKQSGPLKRRRDDSALTRASQERSPSPSPSREKARKGKKSPNSKSRKVLPLALDSVSLQTVRDGFLADKLLHTSKDELLHLDHGVIMTYRVLEGKQLIHERTRTHEKNASLRYHSHLAEREKNMHLDQVDLDSSLVDSPPYSPTQSKGSKRFESERIQSDAASLTIVVIPDITMTLDTLQLHLEGLINVFPYAKIVLVGLLGLPNTVWPTQWVLNSDLQARAIAHLVLHLHNQHILLHRETNSSLLFMGLGFGAYHLSRFVSQHLQSLPPLVRESTKGAVLVNGFLRVNKKLRSICRDFRIALQDATLPEAHELIISLHFCDEFLAAHNRHETFAKFWATRRNLQSTDSNINTQTVKNLSGFIGVLEQLKGVTVAQDDFDGAVMLTKSELPVLVIQGTENVFVDPINASVFDPGQLPPLRTMVNNVVDALEPNAVYVAWLKAGHEMLQERNAFVLGTLSSLIKLLGMPMVEQEENKSAGAHDDSTAYNEDLFDVLSGDVNYDEYRDKKGGTEDDLHLEEFSFNQPFSIGEMRPIQDDFSITDKSNGSQATSKEPFPSIHVVDKDAEEESDAGESEAVSSKAKRAQLALERKKAQLKQHRLHQLEVFYQREREEKERNMERKESKHMAKEDLLSRYAAEYALQLEISEVSKQLAKEKLSQLKKLRDEEAAKKAEEERALQRSIRIEQRRKKAESLIKKIENEELTLQGMKGGGYELPKNPYDINGTIEVSNRVLCDLMECRQKYVEAISRQNLMEEKFDVFRKQLGTIENEERRLRRAIRLIEINPAIVGQELNPETQLQELRTALDTKQNTLNEMSSTYKQREQQLYVTNRNVQLLKLASHDRDRLMSTRLQELNKLEIELNNRLKEHKVVKENLLIQKDKLRMQMLTHQRRLDIVEKELLRIKGHKGKLVDTDIWMEGVMQRCVTKELKIHLKAEVQKASESKAKVGGELDGIRHQIFEVSERIAQAKRDVEKVSVAIKVLHRSYNKFSATPILDIAKNFKRLKAKAEQLELQRSKTSDIEKIFLNANHNSLVDKVRLKESEIRTKDERQFVGLDLILNPEQYIHLSNIEIEQMQFDMDYHSTLAKSDIERLLKLPEQVNLALPFLHTPEEINAHRLLNKFMRNFDDSYFRNSDYMAGSDEHTVDKLSVEASTHSGLDGTGLTAENVEAAEMIHDILIKESLRDRIRGSFEDENLSEAEKKWAEIDKVLSPHIYGLDEEENGAGKRDEDERSPFDIVKEENIVSMTSSSIKPASTLRNVKIDGSQHKLNSANEGDVYQPLRDLYDEHGDNMFIQYWRCPFSSAQLLHIHKTSGSDLTTKEELEVKELLNKYYVSDSESTMGHAKFTALLQVSSDLVKAIQTADEKAENELKANKLKFEKMKTEDDLALETSRSMTNESVGGDGIEDKGLNGALEGSGDGEGSIKRIWGAWSQVHPASQGLESQKSYFMLSSFDASRDHPASYGIHDEDELKPAGFEDDNEEHSILSGGGNSALSQRQQGLMVLQSTSNQSMNLSKLMSNLNDPRSNFFIADSIEELAQQDSKSMRGKICLLMEKEPMVLFDIKGSSIQPRQSRSHYFSIPDRESQRILELTVSIVFQGTFATTGYRLGRIAASLFRLPPDDKAGILPPVRVGYSPYEGVSPNLPDSMGRIVIYHKPKQRPLPPGTFQLIIGSAANTVYSIVVHAKYARSALPVIDEGIDAAKKMQARLPICLEELDGIAESLRLAERKLFVCERMIQEGETETDRCQQGMRILRDKIGKDDEDMLLMEDERRDLERELSILEVEYAEWARLFASRCKEKEDIREGIEAMYKFRREREEEKENIQKKLESARRDLPASIRILRTMTEAVNVAMSLNTDVIGVSEEAGAAATGDFGGIRLSTPAEDIRRVLKQYGFGALMLEEQQWCLLDQTINPNKYEWLREKEEKERQERLALGKKPKDDKSNPALEPFKINKSEIEYILETPFSMLNRREVKVRKLLTKYHDDVEYMKKALSAVAYNFDPHLAERVRSKHPKSYSKEEREWASVDRVLHPEVRTSQLSPRHTNLYDYTVILCFIV
ncbi:hypothetical protein EON65_18680 [archaeon]|nr:MAG: hypothetical protein EON65_18680 [archaeon]